MYRSILLLGFLCAAANAGQIADTLMLSEPAISKTHIAFTYAGDIWVADRDGRHPRRLTSHIGREDYPAFSPDGRHLVFSGEYDGNVDVYIVPVTGGNPRRLTRHPKPDRAMGFTPDGKQVLLGSARLSFAPREISRLFLVSTGGGLPQPLPMPTANLGAFDRTGRRIAYTPLQEAYAQWKNYRGGRISRIWIVRPGQDTWVEIPKPEGGCNDNHPMWIGGKVYFTSDRAGEFNLFRFDPRSKQVDQLTRFDDYPVLNPSSGDGKIIYEQAGYLRLLDPATGKDQRLKIALAADLDDTRPRTVSGAKYVRNGHLAPDGKRAVLEVRGEIVTVPPEKGEPRHLTQSAGSHDRDPAWSPDGKWIAWFSDASGEYKLHITDPLGKKPPRKLDLDGSGFYHKPTFSPDSKKIAYTDNAMSIRILDLETEKSVEVAGQVEYGPPDGVTPNFSFSPDSAWLAYDLRPDGLISSVYVYNLESGKSTRITDGMSEVLSPAFDKSGKYLFFLASTDAGPAVDWFAQSSSDFTMSHRIYMAVLSKDIPSPLARTIDEPVEPEAGDQKEGTATVIDFEGLDRRIQVLPGSEGYMSSLAAGKSGELFFLTRKPSGMLEGITSPGALTRYSLEDRKAETLVDNVTRFAVSHDGSKMLYQANGQTHLAGTASKASAVGGQLNMERVKIRIVPRMEWAQILREAWRLNRDYFYATNYHGVDWNAMYLKYKDFVQHAASRDDLNKIIRWMCSELAVGHHYVSGGERVHETKTIPIGLLGADFDVDKGRYRITRIYGGLNWNPELRSPLAVPGVEVNEGDYLLAVQGNELRVPQNPFIYFEHTVGRAIEITVGPHPDGKDARTVTVEPIGNENNLRLRDWAEGNIRRVHEATNGRAAYVYVPNTGGSGHAWFKRYFFPQTHKEAIIVDDRWNRGGLLADYYVDHLRRPAMAWWATRHGRDIRAPHSTIQGPKVMITNEFSSSGGDYLPFMFRKLGLGTLVGKRTWGGLVGVLGFPVLMDGGGVTAPDIAIWTQDGYVVENEGVAPDIEVELEPGAFANGRDSQLEKAIEVVLEDLKKNPPSRTPERPPFPVRNQ
ncbi:MAG: PDZ domain-containing protein [Acidobacteriota bacterium]|nr:PDZ domain-containing protein [Acidobacteriota bacterium]